MNSSEVVLKMKQMWPLETTKTDTGHDIVLLIRHSWGFKELREAVLSTLTEIETEFPLGEDQTHEMLVSLPEFWRRVSEKIPEEVLERVLYLHALRTA